MTFLVPLILVLLRSVQSLVGFLFGTFLYFCLYLDQYKYTIYLSFIKLVTNEGYLLKIRVLLWKNETLKFGWNNVGHAGALFTIQNTDFGALRVEKRNQIDIRSMMCYAKFSDLTSNIARDVFPGRIST